MFSFQAFIEESEQRAFFRDTPVNYLSITCEQNKINDLIKFTAPRLTSFLL
jgi:hypothetical protein